VREQFRIAIAPYVLDGAVSEEVGTAVQVKKVHRKRRASERLSSSPAARTPKRARLGSSTDHGDGVGVKLEESVPHLDLASMHRSLESKRRAQDG
jgi:hypothetical protein